MPSPPEYLFSSQPYQNQSMCSAETSTTSSPSRISFSFNFCQLVEDHGNGIPLHQASSSSPGNTSPDFEFRVIDCCTDIFSSADQKATIFPSEMMMIMDQQNYLHPLPFLSPLYSSPPPPLINKHIDDDDDDIQKLQSKSTSSSSFWGGFKKPSNSNVNNYSDHHHHDITQNNLSYLFPIPVLRRTSSNERMLHNHNNNHKQQQQQSAAAPKMVKSSSLTSASRLFPHKPEVLLRKSRSSGGGSYYGGGPVKVSPVLHFRAPNCISKATKTTTSLFGCFSARGNSNGKKKNQT